MWTVAEGAEESRGAEGRTRPDIGFKRFPLESGWNSGVLLGEVIVPKPDKKFPKKNKFLLFVKMDVLMV